MKNLFFFCLVISNLVNAQVGINTPSPAATLDITGKPTSPTSLDGVLPPRLTGDQLNDKTYTVSQNGAVVYVTDPASAVKQIGQTINVNNPGIYYFDGPSLTWINLVSPSVMTTFRSVNYQALDLTSNADQIITFTAAESTINNATTFNDNDDTFTIKYDGFYQTSAFIGFNANRSSLGALEYVAVNLKIQLSIDNGATWSNATGVRSVYPGITAATGTSIQVPTTILSLKKGNLVRFVIERPNLLIGNPQQPNQSFGDYLGVNGHVNRPNGQTYTKFFTLIKMR